MKPAFRIHKRVLLAASLTALWLVLSGFFNPLMLTLGAGSVALCVWLAHRMGVFDEEVDPGQFPILAVLRYWVWLSREIVLSALDVARRVLDPALPIEPQVLRVKAGQRGAFGRTTYANSITLTPGTVSMDLVDGVVTVHALTAEAAEALREGGMNRRVAALERGD